MNEWLFRSFLRWARAVGLDEVKRLAAEGQAKHVHGGGRQLTSTSHGGKVATFTFPAQLGVADLNIMIEKVIWLMETMDEDELDNYQANYPSSVAHGRFGMWWP